MTFEDRPEKDFEKQIDDLPGILGEIASVAGRSAALKIAEERGGTVCYIAKRLKEDNWLVLLLGREKAQIIADHLNASIGGHFHLPLGPTSTQKKMVVSLQKLIMTGASSNRIASQLGIDKRTVHRHKARMGLSGKDPRQGDLFE